MKKSSIPWWSVEGDCHKEIFATVRQIDGASSIRKATNIRNLRLYGSMDTLALGHSSYINASTTPQMPDSRMRINIVSSMVDSSGARISKMKPRVSFLTQGGEPSAQKQAKQLSKFTLGAFYLNKIHEKHQQAFRDGQIFDIGAVKHWQDGTRIHSERVLAPELYTDPLDGLYGTPKCLYQVKYIPKSVAQPLWPKYATAIEMAKEGVEASYISESFIEEFVCVVEAWRLPSTPGANDGRHVISVCNQVLKDEKWEKSYFPFTFFRWSKPVVGFWGQSLAERLTSIQVEINKMLRIIQRSFHLGSAFKVLMEHGSKISKDQINNDIGSIITYLGTKPEYVIPKVVQEEFFQHLRFLIQSAYEETGISQLSASSRKPAGLDSGKALREYNDIESERFALVSQDYEASYLETAKIYVDLANDIKKKGGDFAVKAQSKHFIEEIKWSEVAPLDENAYIMQMFPTSMLPHEPAGRLAFVQELINSGMIPADWGLALLDFPDTEAYASLKNAALDDLMATMEQLAMGEYQPPEPFQDLQNGIPLMQSAYLRYRLSGLPDTQLENFRKWIASAVKMLEKAQASQQQQQGPAPTLPVEPNNQAAPGSQQIAG